MKTIEELAREAGINPMRSLTIDDACFARFAAIVRAQAMEEAALVVERFDETAFFDVDKSDYAYAIRAAAQEVKP